MAEKNMDADINVDFEESASRQQLNSGENVTTLFGKIKKFFTDLKAVAFSGSYDDLIDKPDLSEYAKIKSTDFFAISNSEANMIIWKVSENKIPIFLAVDGFYSMPFLGTDGTDPCYLANLIHSTNHSYAVGTPVSGRVYYIEL